MHKLMQVMAGEQRRRALLGPDEVEGKERQDTAKGCPWQNLTQLGLEPDRVAGAWIKLVISCLTGIACRSSPIRSRTELRDELDINEETLYPMGGF